MKTVPAGILIAYDADTGKKLFTELNRATRWPDGTSSLPHARALYLHDNKNYRIVGVREGSTETIWEIDVHEETDQVRNGC